MINIDLLQDCRICPRNCSVERVALTRGYCNCGDKPLVSSVFLHKGEEPIISGVKGICNVFFAHCNLHCIYCQNYQISQNTSNDESWLSDRDEIVEKISEQLDKGVKLLGFVSPSHQVVQMIQIIESVWARGYKPVIVYNSNGYDSVNTLKELEGIVDVWLPDFKYFSNEIGREYSKVNDYFDIASKAIQEMYRQKGSTIILDDDGLIESGLIIRHLVLPGCPNDSERILQYIADELSPNIKISLMAQYYPTINVRNRKDLTRTITKKEYQKVVGKLEELGFQGWIQALESSNTYKPDFLSPTPFTDSIND